MLQCIFLLVKKCEQQLNMLLIVLVSVHVLAALLLWTCGTAEQARLLDR